MAEVINSQHQGVRLAGIKAAEVSPTVGSEGRTSVQSPKLDGLFAAINSGVTAAGEYGKAKDEQAAALSILDAVPGMTEGDKSFAASKPEDAAVAAGAAVVQETGMQLGAQEQGALESAAAFGQRVNDAIAANPDSLTHFNLLKAKTLRSLIAGNAHLAKEFRSLIYGENTFITASMDSIAATNAQNAKTHMEAVNKVRDDAYAAGNSEVINMTTEEFQKWYATSDYGNNIKLLEDSKREADTYKAIYDKGTAISDENTRRIVEQSTPGLVQLSVGKYEEIISGAGTEAEKMKMIDSFVIERRIALSKQLPWLSSDQINTKFSNILKEIPESYKAMGGSGYEATEAKNKLSIFKDGVNLDLERRYGKSTVEFQTQIIRNLQGTDMLRNYDKFTDGPAFKKFTSAMAADEFGDNGADPKRTRMTDEELKKDAMSVASLTGKLLGGFDALDPQSRRAASQMVVNELASPDNVRSPAKLDVMFGMMAQPNFRKLAQTEEFKQKFVGEAQRAVDNYLVNFDKSVGEALQGLPGAITPRLDREGVLNLIPPAGSTQAQKDAVARTQNKLRNVILSDANIQGRTAEESSRAFLERISAK